MAQQFMMMPAVSGSNRRFVFLSVTAAIVIMLWLFTSSGRSTAYMVPPPGTGSSIDSDLHVDEAVVLDGKAIAPKLGNETLKAELGRAAWKVFHTTLARFPERPTADESASLRTYIHLFQKLYPCGECADHFGSLLKKYPPQVSSRNVAAGWGCHIHNKVNEEIGKRVFDCSQIGDFYDCGCADDEKKAMNARAAEPLSTEQDTIAPPSGDDKPKWDPKNPFGYPPGDHRLIKTDKTYVNMGFMKYEMSREQMRALQQTGRSLAGAIYKPTEESNGDDLGKNWEAENAMRGSPADGGVAPKPPKANKEPVEWDDTEDPWKVGNYLPDTAGDGPAVEPALS